MTIGISAVFGGKISAQRDIGTSGPHLVRFLMWFQYVMSKNLGRITVSSSGFLPDSDRSHQCPAGRWNWYKSWKKGLKKADRDGRQQK